MMDNEFAMPEGAWDCHVHVVGGRDAYPMIENRAYTPGPAGVDELGRHLARHRLCHPVIIQPSFYGTDNRCMLDALAHLEGGGRGIAVLEESVGERDLRDLHARGIRGVRINMESYAMRDGDSAAAEITRWSEKIAFLGWHVQAYAAPKVIAALADRIDRLPVRFVLDHFAMIPAAVESNDPELKTILDLLASGNTYVKLSAPYRISADPEQDDERIARLARMFHEAAPQRVLWGTDWPHTNREPGVDRLDVSRYRQVPAPHLLQPLRQWQAMPEVLDRILRVNPESLYR